MNVLSLDVASTTSWAIDKDTYGTWDMRTRKDESMGMKLIRFRAKLKEVIKKAEISIVLYERPAGQHTSSVMHQSKLIAIIEEECESSGVEYRAYSAKELKQFATGKGNSGKPAMIAAAKERWDYPGEDDNEADAIIMRELFRAETNL